MDTTALPDVRRLQPLDHEAASALFRSAYPLRTLEVETWAEPNVVDKHTRYVAVAGSPERIVAYSALWRFRLDGYRMDLIVAPDSRRRGVGGRLLTRLISAARAQGAVTLQARVDEGRDRPLKFLHANGFAETMRMHRQTLVISAATLGPYEHIERRLAGAGIAITTLEQEEAHDPLCWTKFRDLHHATAEGWVDPDPRQTPDPPQAPEEFRRRYRRADGLFNLGADGCFLAQQGDRYVGFTGVFGTGVHPAFRGRGIATALKVRAVALARARGETTMSTSSGNPAMLKVNERLGFRPTSTEIRLVKPIG